MGFKEKNKKWNFCLTETQAKEGGKQLAMNEKDSKVIRPTREKDERRRLAVQSKPFKRNQGKGRTKRKRASAGTASINHPQTKTSKRQNMGGRGTFEKEE
ncbi:hypothetical protein O6P43_020201 [Quillaja saponaria]|uniref:Uncharacterized protein n=1 Tax=Quillaja saponaria TaxID=32244 RepID=A0AAD7PL62_QUISA|nr:hypothetical protein O6P43_020201 [Quillaja saponaria]